ncbi:pyruvate, phosphate dikinase [Salsipaludibacter albus]|uniref:pyruvate, phosphate dikinase n=1 Tax=Salsipaludibacter albus TaxID=2849650 RepID=UPI001EE40203|nr:pyruvate, phosphate dikinase [Salsipaludibacter albus]MBY5163491.1 pyruvate, phosphate dikinase [Salsipaludibacter albus]
MAPRWLQDFRDGTADQADLLGGKGANLAEMTRMGLPVPPGFTVTTDACRAYMAGDGALPHGLVAELDEAVVRLEDTRGKQFGDASDPLLVSVRSGARFSMPGMMDTVLDLGLNHETVKGLAEASGDAHLAYDSWRRFVEMFAKVVLDVDAAIMDDVRSTHLEWAGVADPSELDTDAAHDLVVAYRSAVEGAIGRHFPDDPREQLQAAVAAVFRSWNGRRARDYRRMEGIPDDLGTAVNVQSMVFGNLGDDSGTGVVFTRDPATGEATPYGDFLLAAQGEDVVAGIRNSEPFGALADHFPDCHAELLDVLDRLEERYHDMCDVEFTVEQGRLWVLQTRVGKRSAPAAVRIAVELVDEGLLEPAEAVARVQPTQLERLLHPGFDAEAAFDVLTTGLGASPGAASGHVAFTADEAEARAADGESVILVRPETSPEDLHGLISAVGVLTSRGGLVSHAAVVARGIGTPAVCGADELVIDLDAQRMSVNGTVVEDGDLVSIDGTTGEVVLGEVPVVVPEPTPELARLLDWADDLRRLGVRANADTPEDARRARAFGAEGIGLCRTEHMFLGDRLPIVQRMILEDGDGHWAALDELHDLQRADFEAMLEAMDGLPVTVRLLDPPLHEFLPDLTELRIAEATDGLDDAGQEVLAATEHWDEHNPMLGIRGVRLSALEPGLYRMQVRALMEAAMARVAAGGTPRPHVMIPLTVSGPELAAAVAEAWDVIEEVVDGTELDVRVGTMVETPRAALRAAELAPHADFCSFGTNDLTQMTFGFSRDDVEARLMPVYLQRGLLPADPFATIDVDGVGRLVELAIEEGRAAAPDLEFGVCGEHGGDPASVAFFDRAGLDYVSCSPFRLPVARLAAAHAALAAGDAATVPAISREA